MITVKLDSPLHRPHTELEPYKYAGYPMLIKTITMETEDDQLFSKTSPLLPAAVELAFHTVNCSALNAEELRRDSGMEVKTYSQILKSLPVYMKHIRPSIHECGDRMDDELLCVTRCCWRLFPAVSPC